MRGSITKRGAKWVIRYRDPEGRQKWQSFSRKVDAERALTGIVGAVHKGEYQPRKDILFRDLAGEWLKASKAGIKPTTFISYEGHVRNYLVPKFGHLQVRAIDPKAVALFFAELSEKGNISPTTVGNLVTTLKSILKVGVAWGYLARNPAEAVRKPKVAKVEMDFLEPAEIQAMLAAADSRHYPLLLTACMTGMRRSEVLALRWGDIDWRGKAISVRKQTYRGQLVDVKTTHSRRRIAVGDKLLDTLREHQARQIVAGPENPMGLVFVSEAGTPIDGSHCLVRIFWPTLTRAGLRRVRFHDLRHSYAALLISRNVPLKLIQRQMGHSSIQVTADRYGHLLQDVETAAAEHMEEAILGTAQVALTAK